MNNIYRFFASGAYISYLPTALLKNNKNTGAGLLGSLEGFLLFLFFMPQCPLYQTVVTVVFILFAVFISQKAVFGGGREDDPKIVIDEIAGFFVAAAFLPKDGFAVISAFILFRIFDTLKPYPIKKLEKLAQGVSPQAQKKYYLNGLCIVLDDIVAGIFANALTRIFIYFNLF